MYKSTFFLIIILNISTLFGQKNEIYVNDNLEIITVDEFNKIESLESFINLKFDVDTAFVNVKVKRLIKKKISIALLDSIKSNLSFKKDYFSKDDIIIINYYPGMDYCNSSGHKSNSYISAKYQNYERRINRVNNVKQFFVFTSKVGTEKYGKLKWVEDKNALIESVYFPLHYPCGSFVLIDPNGNCYIYKGEYNIDDIFELLKDKKTFTSDFN